ncbi:MAG: acyl carrier protein [Lachnospiraceae bacterium]|nr:acyl carrier protein [Lachnospiraceae bacterium]
MEELMEILEDVCPDVDFESETSLMDDKVLSSFDVISIVSEINETFGVRLTPAEIIPANFNSVDAIWDMICKLKGDKA